ncbi:hypothetical protein B0T10DRAFT_131046 [Thelonectria olida]|uniref:Uncharacterized protein n=1 Tax=Thelonectria olida TaxID=1576542 RepID=A0A9P8W1B5_9HYPO|nr:hypothetical protein B0T10DRAFT_131046 [Thelonectria olida]
MGFEGLFVLLGTCFRLYSYMAFFYPCWTELVPRVLCLLQPVKFASQASRPVRNRGDRRRLQRDDEKKRKRRERALQKMMWMREISDKRKGKEVVDSVFPVFRLSSYFLSATFWICVAGDAATGGEGAGHTAVEAYGKSLNLGNFPHALSRLISRYALSWSVKHLALATSQDRHVISSTTLCYQRGDDPSEVRRVELALPQQTPPHAISIFIHAHVQYLLPWTEKHSALFRNVVGTCNVVGVWDVAGIVGFGTQHSPAPTAFGQKRAYGKDGSTGVNRKKPRGLGYGSNFDPDDHGDRDEDRKGNGLGNGHYNPPKDPCDQFWACPFFLLDPVRHWRCLGKYTMKRYSDVKLHMLRCHTFEGQHYCKTCGTEWKQMAPWAAHIRVGCSSADPAPSVDNLDSTERDIFKAKEFKKEPKGFGDRDKFNWMWRTFFADHELPESPYVQDTIVDPRTLFRRNGVPALQAWLDSRPPGERLNAAEIADILLDATVDSPPRFRRSRNRGSQTAVPGPTEPSPVIPSSSTNAAPGPSVPPDPGPSRTHRPPPSGHGPRPVPGPRNRPTPLKDPNSPAPQVSSPVVGGPSRPSSAPNPPSLFPASDHFVPNVATVMNISTPPMPNSPYSVPSTSRPPRVPDSFAPPIPTPERRRAQHVENNPPSSQGFATPGIRPTTSAPPLPNDPPLMPLVNITELSPTPFPGDLAPGRNTVYPEPWDFDDAFSSQDNWDDFDFGLSNDLPLSNALIDEYLTTEEGDGTGTAVLVAPGNVGDGANAPRSNVPPETRSAPAGTIDPRVLGNQHARGPV